MPMPEISVVMPSLNQAAFLAEAVHSVLRQEGVALELVVADGGSTDGSQALLATLAAQYPGRLHWHSGPDSGPADAVNQAVARSRAPLLGWLNADDLYTPGAVARAVAHLRAHPAQQMVYGHGDHVDVDGRFLARYPTLLPDTPLAAWMDGCHICQPTAFFRRGLFESLGGLDTSLRASFDYDLWLRVFRAHPAGVGFIDAVQACSRLHEAGITARMRERVAFEGMQVIRRHLGPAPAHWLLTHFNELCAAHPFLPGEPLALRERCERMVERARPLLDAEGLGTLWRRVAQDRRLALATAGLHVAVDEDGWAGPELELRVRRDDPDLRGWRLLCRQRAPGGGGRLRLLALAPDGGLLDELTVDGNGVFDVRLPLAPAAAGAHEVYRIHTEGGFVPARCEPGSDDRRTLTFLVEAVLPP